MANLLDAVLRGRQEMWNEARLARAFLPAYGFPMYPAQNALGPIIGTPHFPLGYLVYTVFAFLKDPALALLAASCFSILLCLGPLTWIHRRAALPGGSERLISAYGFLACVAILLSSPAGTGLAVNVHVDASAIGCTVLAAGILAMARVPVGNRALAASAVLSILAVACKQSMLPVPAALACFVLITERPARFARYVGMQILAGATVGSAILAMFHPLSAFLFNTYTWGMQLHTNAAAALILKGLYTERVVLGAVIPALAVLIGYAFFDQNTGVRQLFRSNPSLVFLLIAVFLIPTALRGFTIPGADYNHLSTVVLLVTMSVTVGLVSSATIPALIQRGLLAGIIVAALPIPWTLANSIASRHEIPAETAFQYEKRHPGRAYFPTNALAALLADGKATHFDYSLADRDRARLPISAAQFASGIPPHFVLVAYPPGYDPPQSSAVLQLLHSMRRTTEPELDGWVVYGSADGGAK